MARTPNKDNTVIDLDDKSINTEKMAEGLEALRSQELAVIEVATATETRTRAVATTLGYSLPADACDPDLIQRDIMVNMRRSVEACLEVGKGLCVLKESCEHGNFMARLAVMEFEGRVARRFMASAIKFSNRATSPVLTNAVGNQSKLFEMLVLDDEQLEELELTGQTGELKLDEFASMSVKEMRASLRKAVNEKRRADAVIQEINGELINLKLERKVVTDTRWPDALEPLADQVAAAGRKLAQGMSELESCRLALFAAGNALDDEKRQSFDAAASHVAEVYQEALARAERGLEKERNTFEKTLGLLAGGAQ